MPGSLSSGRPGADAYTTRQEGTWSEPSKDAIGVYRGKSKTRDEGYSKSTVKVGVATPGTKAMGQPPSIGQATFKRKRK
jgi:hypothetical protein